MPVLRRYGFTATLFMLTGRAGATGWNDLDLVDWETLRVLEEEGVIRVESHTHRMHTKVQVGGQLVPRFVTDVAELGRDLETSRAAIRHHLGHDARYLAWPFGYGNAAVDSLARASGMRRVLTLRPHRNLPDFAGDDESLPGLGRYAVTARTSFRVFQLMVRS